MMRHDPFGSRPTPPVGLTTPFAIAKLYFRDRRLGTEGAGGTGGTARREETPVAQWVRHRRLVGPRSKQARNEIGSREGRTGVESRFLEVDCGRGGLTREASYSGGFVTSGAAFRCRVQMEFFSRSILNQLGGENDLGELALFEPTFAGLPGPLSGPAPPCPAMFRPSSGTHPLPWSSRGHFVVTPPPCLPFVAGAAAANINPRTRLSHMTEIPSLLGS